VCCLMFDEMSVRENVHFNQKFGCIGNQDKANNVAIMSWSSCSVVSVKSGSSQYLNT